MLSTAIIIFREMLEIALILGVVMAATRELKGRIRWILGGIAAGLAGAGVVAFSAEAIAGAMAGSGQEMFNAMILFTAALMIGWTLVWVRRHAREMTAHFRDVGKQVGEGRLPFYSLSMITGLAILREGSEMVMFIYAALATGQNVAFVVAGSLLGGVLGLIAGVMLYMGLIKMSARYMLNFTSWVLLLLVAGLTAHAAGYLTAAGYFETMSDPVWDTSWLLAESSLLGQTLHTLIGYTEQPSAIQLIFYVGTFVTLGWLSMRVGNPVKTAAGTGATTVGNPA
jgi:high-affinity iron transporter